MRYVFDFDEASDGGRELLGGKGIGLAEMTQLGVPVPAGFTITTEACRAYMRGGRRGARRARRRDRRARRRARGANRARASATTRDPLLVSVRSGAAVSMPGMMDTILNLGLNDVAVEGLATLDRQPRASRYDSYRRLIQMYGEVVDGVDGHRFEQALADLKAARGVAQDVDLDRGRPSRARRDVQGDLRGGDRPPVPAGRRASSFARAYRAVFDSWDAPRAQVYRRAQRHPGRPRHGGQRRPDGLRQQGRELGHRRLLHARPVDRRAAALRRVPRRTRRARTSSPASARRSRSSGCSERLPEAFEQLVETLARLEEHYRDMQDIEFTVEEGTLYLLQTRTGKRTAAAALRVGRGDGRRGADLPRGGGRADRPGAARPAAAPDDRPRREGRGRRDAA